MFAQIIYLPCDRCRELGEGTWSWWLAQCWAWPCDYPSGGVIAVGLIVASVVGVQLWNAHKQPKA